MLTALAGLAMLSFRSTFAGPAFLVVGLAGVVLGILVTHIANVLRLPAIIAAAGGIAVYYLLGGPLAAGASAVPSPATLRLLSDAVVRGWRDLLTTVPPVNGSGTPLLLPYLLGLAVGVAGFSLARRTAGPAWPLLAVLAQLAAVILLGSLEPAAIVPPATGFAVLALFWASARQARLRPIVTAGSGRAARVAIGAVLLIATGIGAQLVGPHLPGAGSADRVALRRYVTPPTDIGSYSSPLASYRHFAGLQQDADGNPISLADQELFEVAGDLPAGTAIRFATLDRYDGLVWGASDQIGDAGGVRNAFLKVGSTLDNPASRPTYTMSVTIGAYDDYWLPSAGAVQAVRFAGGAASRQADDFRYNLGTQTGLVPGTLRSGDAYTLRVAGVTAPALTEQDALAGGGYDSTGDFLAPTAKELAGGATGATAVLRIAEQLRSTGRYTHGDPGGEFAYYLPGHSAGRLAAFVNGVARGFPPFVGDDEQYAAAFAVMIGQLGIPARVVVGAPSLPADGIVRGDDVRAWVEVQSVSGTWLQIASERFIATEPPDKNVLDQRQLDDLGSSVPPPAQGLPKTVAEDEAASEGSSSQGRDTARAGGWRAPDWLYTAGIYGGLPAGVVLAVLLIVVTAKAWRRQRRRARGAPATRLARGWSEIVDHAVDLGSTLPAQSTRREQARAVAGIDLLPLAALADAYVFGGGEISAEHARSFWREVDAARKRMSADVGRFRRFLAAINPVTLIPPARRPAAARGVVPVPGPSARS